MDQNKQKGYAGGAAAGGGFSYQANAFAYVASHMLAGKPLNWFENPNDIPTAISMETGGPGDDMLIEFRNSQRIELQARHGLPRGPKLWETIEKQINGLINDSQLRTILLVDDTSSGTVKNDLRTDIRRLASGRTDNLKDISKEFYERIQIIGVQNETILNRINIIKLDLDERSSGCSAATMALQNIVEIPKETLTAWSLLSQKGLKLIRDRGRANSESLLSLLQGHLVLKSKAKEPSIIRRKYQKWLKEKTSHFFVPVIGKRIPISYAWNKLGTFESIDKNMKYTIRSLEEQISKYHEWERYSRSYLHHDAKGAEEMIQQSERCCIIGGPGAGKTTLIRRMCYWAVKENLLALQVPLKNVSMLLKDGKTIGEAITYVACDGSDVDPTNASKVFSSPDIIFFDGLDECEPNRIKIASKLLDWSKGHPHCRICVTTRPVGHAPDLLPDFLHVELLPLDGNGVEKLSSVLLSSFIDSSKDVDIIHNQFLEAINNQEVSRLAARNPLLLTFLVSLYRSGEDFGENRISLLQKIVELFRRAENIGRDVKIKQDRSISNHSLYTLGWTLTDTPSTELPELIDIVANEFIRAGIEKNDNIANSIAEESLSFWEERRIVERFEFNFFQILMFIHPLICEYSAAMYLARLDSESLTKWLRTNSNIPKWRQPIQLGCSLANGNTIISILLDLDNPTDPLSSESVLALYGLLEMAHPSDEIIHSVSEKASERLVSNIPVVALDAAEVLLDAAKIASDIILPIANELIDNEQSWSRLAGIALALECDIDTLDIDIVIQWFDSFYPVSPIKMKSNPYGNAANSEFLPYEAYSLQKSILKNAVARICKDLEHTAVIDILKPLLESGHLSGSMETIIRDVAVEYGFRKDIAEIRSGKLKESLSEMSKIFSKQSEWNKKASIAFAHFALKAAGGSKTGLSTVSNKEFEELSKLIQAFDIWESPIHDWYNIASRKDQTGVIELLKVYIEVADIDKKELVRECSDLMDIMRKSKEHPLSYFNRIIPILDWSKATQANIDIELLLSALQHPSQAVVIATVKVFSKGFGWGCVQNTIQNMLNTENPYTLRVLSIMSSEIWGDDALDVLLTRLDEDFCEGIEIVFDQIVKLASETRREEVTKRLIAGLSVRINSVSHGAAKSLYSSGWKFSKEELDKIQSAYTAWTKHGNHCNRCDVNFFGDFCPECHIGIKNPRVPLVELLISHGVLGFDELQDLITDVSLDVSRVSRRSIAQMACDSETLMKSVLEKISDMTLPRKLLTEILSLDSKILTLYSEELIDFIYSSEPEIRIAVIHSLTKHWLPDEDTMRILRELVSDPIPSIRDNATRTMRLYVQEDG